MYTLVLLLCLQTQPGHTTCSPAYQHNLASVAECSAVRSAIVKWAAKSNGHKVVAFAACRNTGRTA